MSRPSLFTIRAIRPFTLGVRRVLPGSEVAVDPGTATELIRSGKARLVDEADVTLLIDAARGRPWGQPLTR